jgi:hypothetical protein
VSNETEIVITTTDKSAAGLKSAQQNVKGFQRVAQDTSKNVDQAFAEVGASARRAATEVGSAASGIGQKAGDAGRRSGARIGAGVASGVKDSARAVGGAAGTVGTEAGNELAKGLLRNVGLGDEIGSALGIDPAIVGGVGEAAGDAFVDGYGETILSGAAGLAKRAASTAASTVSAFASTTLAMVKGTAAVVASTAATVAQTVATVAANVAAKAWAAGQWLLNAALTANPIGLVIAAIALLVVGIIYAYRHSEKFRIVVQAAMRGAVAAWQALRTAVTAAVHWIVGRMAALVSNVRRTNAAIRSAFSVAYHAIVDPIDRAVRWALGRLADLVAYVRDIPGKITGAVSGAVSGAWDKATGWVPGRASGGPASGLTMLGERGRELVRLPAGSQVIPHGQTEAMMSGSPGGRGDRVVWEVRSSGSAVDDMLAEIIRRFVRVKGGDVQATFG